MILLLALRSLAAHPIRSAVLAMGFGLGVAVMAILLGVGQVVLEQAQSPELAGGGDVLVTGAAGDITAARIMLGGVLKSPPLGGRIRAASPWSRATLYLIDSNPGNSTIPIRARGGIPSLERGLGDSEVSDQKAWTDTIADATWTSPEPGDLLRTIDRFHPIPDVPSRAHSWAEWLYFNGRSTAARFYLTFLVGPRMGHGRAASVRLQIDRGRGTESFGAFAVIDTAAATTAPDLSIGNNHVRLDGLRYRLHVDLAGAGGRRAVGEIVLTGSAGRLIAPVEIHGARGWRSGYVVPVMSGSLGGSLVVDGQRVSLEQGIGYHDHNWGFWEGVSWQWGQVHHGDTSFVYGRIFPPRDAADPERMPGFLGALGPEGPVGYASYAVIDEMADAGGRPSSITIRGRSATLDLTLRFTVESTVTNRMSGGPLDNPMDFLQMRGTYAVEGMLAGRSVAFHAPGSAETFRGR